MSNEDIEKNTPETEQPEVDVTATDNTQDLAAALAEAQQTAEAHWDELLRARAEMENQRRRHSRDLESAHRHALDKFVAELMPICDSLELGLDASRKDGATLDTLREGMDMTLKMLLGSIGKMGLEQISPEGDAFDPEAHQAVAMQPAEGVASNTVIAVMQKGYRFNGRLLRPAMVVVSQ